MTTQSAQDSSQPTDTVTQEESSPLLESPDLAEEELEIVKTKNHVKLESNLGKRSSNGHLMLKTIEENK